MSFNKVVIQQVDMDTALTAFLLGVSPQDNIVTTKNDALVEDLSDPKVLCIEAGGSGQVELNNFDHHNTTDVLPPACYQALKARGKDTSLLLGKLAEYVSAMDQRATNVLGQSPGFPTLSDIFSGMRLSIKDPVEQLRAGISIFNIIVEEQIDPFGLMPEKGVWQSWLITKKEQKEALAKISSEAEIFTSKNGIKIGYLQTSLVGVHGLLYQLGCQVVIAYSPNFGEPPIAKYSIGGNNIKVDNLLPSISELESSWGGPAHGTIIASPRTGSRLTPEQIKNIVINRL